MNDIRSVQGYIVLYACREILREFLHFCLYSFGNVQRVAARLLIDSDGSGGFPVQLGYYAVRGRAHETGRNLVCRLLLEKKKLCSGVDFVMLAGLLPGHPESGGEMSPKSVPIAEWVLLNDTTCAVRIAEQH